MPLSEAERSEVVKSKDPHDKMNQTKSERIGVERWWGYKKGRGG